MKMLSAIPALPVLDTTRAVMFYRERLGFISKGDDDALGIMVRDDIELHLWEANDPGTLGAEPHLAGVRRAEFGLRVWLPFTTNTPRLA